MTGFPATSREERTRTLMLVGGMLLLMAGLLFSSKLMGETPRDTFGGEGPPAEAPRGNYQPAPMVPNTPLTGVPGGSPLNDTPDVTIVQDVRETMNRLPLDRNTPKGWSNPKPTKRKG
jgi:hypothetical protein